MQGWEAVSKDECQERAGGPVEDLNQIVSLAESAARQAF